MAGIIETHRGKKNIRAYRVTIGSIAFFPLSVSILVQFVLKADKFAWKIESSINATHFKCIVWIIHAIEYMQIKAHSEPRTISE